MAKRKGNKSEITSQITELLDKYEGDVKAAAEKAFTGLAKTCVTRLKAESPRATGDYAKSWTYKKNTDPHGLLDVTVYNREWQLTHLLEHGHIVKNQYGYVGASRKGAKPHIGKVADWADSEIVSAVKKEVEKA